MSLPDPPHTDHEPKSRSFSSRSVCEDVSNDSKCPAQSGMESARATDPPDPVSRIPAASLKTKQKRENVLYTIWTILIWTGGFGLWLWAFTKACEIWTQTDSMAVYIVHVGAALLLLYTALFVQIILHETGHLIAGLAGHLKFLSFRIGPWMWVRENGHLRLKRFRLKGTSGQCLMDVPESETPDKSALFWYNWGGVLANVISGLFCLMIWPVFLEESLWGLFFLATGITGLILAVLNGIPAPASVISNDGRNGLEMLRGPKHLLALENQLHATAFVSQGARPKDLPKEWICKDLVSNPSSCLQAGLSMIHISCLMDAMEWQQALEQIDALLQNSAVLSRSFQQALKLEQAFCLMMTGQNESARQLLHQPDLQKLLKFPSMDTARVRYVQAVLLDQNPEAARQAMTLFKKKAASHPYSGEVKGQEEWMEYALHLAQNNPPAADSSDRTEHPAAV